MFDFGEREIIVYQKGAAFHPTGIGELIIIGTLLARHKDWNRIPSSPIGVCSGSYQIA